MDSKTKSFGDIIEFISELRTLQRIRRSSFQTFGTDMGSIADHTFGVAMIAYLLGERCGADSGKVLLMALLHDIPETRIGDANYINKRYQSLAENRAFQDQVSPLPEEVRNRLRELFDEYAQGLSLEARITKDADILDQLFAEKLLIEQGYSEARRWFRYSLDRLTLDESKALAKSLMRAKSTSWWTKPVVRSRSRQTSKIDITGVIRTITRIHRRKKSE